MKAQKNPFRSTSVAKVRYFARPGSLVAMAGRVAAKPGGYALIGPQGTGKTTLLEDLTTRLTTHFPSAHIHWFRLHDQSPAHEIRSALRQICQLTDNQIALLDGGEVLGRLSWMRLHYALTQKPLRIIATLHKPNRLTILHKTTADWPTAQQCITQVLGQNPDPALLKQARIAFEENRGNIREVLRACYWEYAKRPEAALSLHQ